jgi:hypothetical protein
MCLMDWRLTFAALALATTACTIDTGAVPDAGACAANPDFFVSDVQSRYFDANQCGSTGCHDFTDGHGTLRLRAPEVPSPVSGTPIDTWPVGWRENYLSAIQLLDCSAPDQSRLLTFPEGAADLHPPGPVVLDRATAATVIETWVSP